MSNAFSRRMTPLWYINSWYNIIFTLGNTKSRFSECCSKGFAGESLYLVCLDA